MPIKKMWGGRFEEAGDQLVDQFGASISFDQEMAKEDIMGSLAHVKMLKATQILTPQDADQIIAGLQELAVELADHGLPFDVENEDIHICHKVFFRICGPGIRHLSGRKVYSYVLDPCTRGVFCA